MARWWASVAGVPAADLWQCGVRVNRHGKLDGPAADADAVTVLRRDDAVRVVVPLWVDKPLLEHLRDQPVGPLLDKKFWSGLELPDRKARRHTVHFYSDTPVSTPGRVEAVEPGAVAGWRDLVSRKKWEASGFADHPSRLFGVRDGGDLAAVAGLTDFLGVDSSVGVLTHPAHRGHGLATRVVRAATSAAVADHGLARFLAEADQHRAQTVATKLGFRPYAEQLVYR